MLLPFLMFGQGTPVHELAFGDYERYRETSLEHRRFKHKDLEPLIEALKTVPGFTVQRLGRSVQGRDIYMISLGEGETDVLLWSQMHGDEPTATMSMFDLFNYFKENKAALANLKLHFIPMLNPDGAEAYSRRNAIGVDINRDALRLQSPEARILKRVRDSLQADFGFNLHDQSIHYNTRKSDLPASISFLAPAFDEKVSINSVRTRAMQVIVLMNRALQEYIPGQVGRYSDAFEARAFGDNMQKWGTSTFLIESGGFAGDPEKQHLRKMNFVSILEGIHSIGTGSYRTVAEKEYARIPGNDRKLFDLKIENLSFPYLGKEYTVDLGIAWEEVENQDHSDFYYRGKVKDKGALRSFFGNETLDASGLQFKTGETYPRILNSYEEFADLDLTELLKKGYTSVSINDLPEEIKFIEYPMNIIDITKIRIPKSNAMPQPPVSFSRNPTFLLMHQDEVVYAVINGFIYDLRSGENRVKNGLVEGSFQ